MKNTNAYVVVILMILFLLLRIFIGIQINFSHVDYEQIYLIGLEYAFSENWYYWGPDVVWSKTRLPGAMLGILVGLPIQLFKHPYAPIIISNIFSFTGLMLLAFYAKKRFPKLSIYFLISLLSLLPYCVFNGVVILNTSYLIFSGAILFISTMELFSYRKEMILNPLIYFFSVGFCFMFTYQLHLTWVMFLPFILVLFYFEWINQPNLFFKICLIFLIGCVCSSLTVLPTFIKYGSEIMKGSGGNIKFEPFRILGFFDFIIRFLGTATIDVFSKPSKFISIFSNSSLMGGILLSLVKFVTVIQFIGICISFYFVKKTSEFKKTLLLFFLGSLMSIILFMLSNKHLQIRTYILLFPIPIWLSLYSYSYFTRFRWGKKLLVVPLVIISITLIGIGYSNFNNIYSFKSVEKKLNSSIEKKDPYQFAERRKTIMDRFN